MEIRKTIFATLMLLAASLAGGAEHTAAVSVHHHNEFEQDRMGMGILTEHTYEKGFSKIFAQPSWKHFHTGEFALSLVSGWEYSKWTPKMGFFAGYDISNIPLKPLEQVSIGALIREESVEIHLRHYKPWPNTRSLRNGTIFKADTHTDCDILLKSRYIDGGFGVFKAQKEAGLKLFSYVYIDKLRISGLYRYSQKMQSSFAVAFTWSMFEGKKLFHNATHFVCRQEDRPYREPTPTVLIPIAEQGKGFSSGNILVYQVD
jgi:hypothetical protein